MRYFLLLLLIAPCLSCSNTSRTKGDTPAFANLNALPTNHWGEARTEKIEAEEIIVFRAVEGQAYNHHPQITSYRGRLIATWSNGVWNEDEPGQVMVMAASTDGGRTWSEPRPIFDKKAGRYNDLVYTSEGIHIYKDTLVAYAGVYEYGEPFEVKQDVVFPKPAPGDSLLPYQKVETTNHRTEIRISTDGGASWSEARVILDNFVPNLKPFITQTGRLILPGNVSFPYTDDPAGIRGWTKTGIPRLPEGYVDAPRWFEKIFEARGDSLVCMEASLFQQEDGLLRAMFRTNRSALATSVSTDDGKSWSEPRLTTYTDCKNRFEFGRLPDGRYFGLTCPRPGAVRTPLILAAGRDGIHFDQHYLIGEEPWEDARIPGRWKYGRYGYPACYILNDSMYVIYTINKEDVAISRFSLSEL